jgi:hypothetical protein
MSDHSLGRRRPCSLLTTLLHASLPATTPALQRSEGAMLSSTVHWRPWPALCRHRGQSWRCRPCEHRLGAEAMDALTEARSRNAHPAAAADAHGHAGPHVYHCSCHRRAGSPPDSYARPHMSTLHITSNTTLQQQLPHDPLPILRRCSFSLAFLHHHNCIHT